jgi:hypothetical protein
MALWKIFRPLVTFRVTIMHDISPTYALQKALAITRNSNILDSVVEVNIRKSKYISRRMSGIPFFLSPSIFILVKAIPAMRKLHTIHFTHMILSRADLYTVLSSPYLIHLILDTVQIPKISKLPPPKLRKLTLVAMISWEALEPLITQLAASLKCLRLQGCGFWRLRRLQLPLFPCLQEIHCHHSYIGHNFPDESRLSELFRLAPQVTFLHLSGNYRHTRVNVFPKSLQHLSIEERTLTEWNFGVDALPQLMSLSIKHYQGWWELKDRLILLSPFICDRFPNIIFLCLNIPWSLRDSALIMAGSQCNVESLEPWIVNQSGLSWEERTKRLELEVSTDYLRTATLPAALQTLKLEMVQAHDPLEQNITPCARWIEYNILPYVTGLGGPDLRGIEVSFIQPESKLACERVLWRRWVKSPNGDWLIEG